MNCPGPLATPGSGGVYRAAVTKRWPICPTHHRVLHGSAIKLTVYFFLQVGRAQNR